MVVSSQPDWQCGPLAVWPWTCGLASEPQRPPYHGDSDAPYGAALRGTVHENVGEQALTPQRPWWPLTRACCLLDVSRWVCGKGHLWFRVPAVPHPWPRR